MRLALEGLEEGQMRLTKMEETEVLRQAILEQTE
jgi:hypothetical protein